MHHDVLFGIGQKRAACGEQFCPFLEMTKWGFRIWQMVHGPADFAPGKTGCSNGLKLLMRSCLEVRVPMSISTRTYWQKNVYLLAEG